MTPGEIESAAEALWQAERTGQQTGLLSRAYPGMTMDEAYAVQAALIRRRCAAGHRVTGWKIGLTSKAMQYALNIDTPDSGVLMEDMHFASGAVVPKGLFAAEPWWRNMFENALTVQFNHRTLAYVIAVLVADDGVVQALRGGDTDRVEVRHDALRAATRVASVEEHRGSIRPDDQSGSAPAHIDVVDAQVLREGGRGKGDAGSQHCGVAEQAHGWGAPRRRSHSPPRMDIFGKCNSGK